MGKFSILMSFFLMIGLSSCVKDLDIIPTNFDTHASFKQELTLNGIVVGTPYATLFFNNREYTSDKFGFFNIPTDLIEPDGELLRVQKEGFFDAYKIIKPVDLNTSFIKISMLQKPVPVDFSSDQDMVHNISENAYIFIPNNSLTKFGIPYFGEAILCVRWYKPNLINFGDIMPGSLLSNDNEQMMKINSYGMMAIEIKSPDGVQLELRDEASMKLIFDIPQILLTDAPSELSSWSLNQDYGFWEKEGDVVLNGSVYECNVSNVGFWNIGEAFEFVKITGQPISLNGNSLPNIGIDIHILNGGIAASNYTNDNGTYHLLVPKEEALEMSIKNDCGTILQRRMLGPFGSDTDNGVFEVNSANRDIRITGTLTSCNGTNISNGYVKITGAGGLFKIIQTDENGKFDNIVLTCFNGLVSVSGLDPQTGIETESFNFQINDQSFLDIGNLKFCESSVEFLTLIDSGAGVGVIEEINNANYSYSNRSINISTDGNSGVVLNILIPQPRLGENFNVQVSKSFTDGSSGSYFIFDAIATISEINLVENGYVEGIINTTDEVRFRIKLENYVPDAPLNCSIATWGGSCFGSNSELRLNVSGGYAPYNYLWDDGSDSYFVSVNENATYQVTITDNNGDECISSIDFKVPDELIYEVNVQNATCGNEDGMISFSGFNFENISIQWDGIIGGLSKSELPVGEYPIIIFYGNGCFKNVMIKVEDDC